MITLLTAPLYYSESKKAGADRTKWTIIGTIVAIVPLETIPFITAHVTKRKDLNHLALMGAAVIVIAISGILIRQIKPPKDSKKSRDKNRTH